jgi:hypothetical protein
MALVMRIAYSCKYTLSTAESVDTLHFLGLASSHKSSALKSKSKSLTFKSKSFGVKSKSKSQKNSSRTRVQVTSPSTTSLVHMRYNVQFTI